MTAELDRMYDEAARLMLQLGALVEEARLVGRTFLCPACRIPTVKGGVCGCDLEVAAAMARLELTHLHHETESAARLTSVSAATSDRRPS